MNKPNTALLLTFPLLLTLHCPTAALADAMSLGKHTIPVTEEPAPAHTSTSMTASNNSDAGSKSSTKVQIISPYFAPEPHSPQPFAPVVLDSLRQLQEAYSQGDFKAYQQLLDDDCSDYDEKTGKTFNGKDKVVAQLRELRAASLAHSGDKEVLLLIDHPIVKVVGETAVVTYRRTEQSSTGKTIGQSYVTCIFAQNGSQWKKLHEATKWTNADGSSQ